VEEVKTVKAGNEEEEGTRLSATAGSWEEEGGLESLWGKEGAGYIPARGTSPCSCSAALPLYLAPTSSAALAGN
jgi:hypothetical protein